MRWSLGWSLAVIVAIALGVSAIGPHDRLTWLLEVLPVLIAAPILFSTRKAFPLTPLLQCLIALHCLILILGAHYTYAHVPLGEWMREAFDFKRNHYDRIGHLAQGFVPAIIAREILLRVTLLRPGGMLALLCTSVVLAFSAFYELIEMSAALISAEAAHAFLATQGDVWDTQMDMFMALIGALVALALLSRWHDRQLNKLP